RCGGTSNIECSKTAPRRSCSPDNVVQAGRPVGGFDMPLTRRVLVTDFAWNDLAIEERVLGSAGASLVVANHTTEEGLVEQARHADAIMTNWKPVNATVLRHAERCVTVARYGVGVD